ncbi:hypothetical protein JW868_00895 [Candidatus Woesearchaeota archaeon]|nr:hypothetical protein [Candidatus Woesearchaeota archaeon]
MKKILLAMLLFIIVCAYSALAYREAIMVEGESLKIEGGTLTIHSIGTNGIYVEFGGTKDIYRGNRSTSLGNVRIYPIINYEKRAKSFVELRICEKDIDEVCNGIDDNCDGRIDEGLEIDCGTDVGRCEKGERKCVNGEWGYCEKAVLPDLEFCNGIDDDCDGIVDNNIEERECGMDVGECQKGIERCIDGEWVCTGQVHRYLEECNGLDDDCDGQVDEVVCPKGNEEASIVEDTEEIPQEVIEELNAEEFVDDEIIEDFPPVEKKDSFAVKFLKFLRILR